MSRFNEAIVLAYAEAFNEGIPTGYRISNASPSVIEGEGPE